MSCAAVTVAQSLGEYIQQQQHPTTRNGYSTRTIVIELYFSQCKCNKRNERKKNGIFFSSLFRFFFFLFRFVFYVRACVEAVSNNSSIGLLCPAAAAAAARYITLET